MITTTAFEEMALSLPGTEKTAHFERIGYKVTGKRMFATYLPTDHTANVFLTPAEQSVFCQIDSENIFPVSNKWGEKGVTTFVLSGASKEVVFEALLSAYNDIIKTKKRGKK